MEREKVLTEAEAAATTTCLESLNVTPSKERVGAAGVDYEIIEAGLTLQLRSGIGSGGKQTSG